MTRWRVYRRNGAWWIYQPNGAFWDVDLYDLATALDRVRGVARMKARADWWQAASLLADEGRRLTGFLAQVDEWAKGNHARWSE